MFVRFAYEYVCGCFQVLMILFVRRKVCAIPKADFADWPSVLACPKRSLMFVQVSGWQIKSRLTPSHCVAHCADFHRHGNQSQFSSIGDGVTQQPLRYMWAKKCQKPFSAVIVQDAVKSRMIQLRPTLLCALKESGRRVRHSEIKRWHSHEIVVLGTVSAANICKLWNTATLLRQRIPIESGWGFNSRPYNMSTIELSLMNGIQLISVPQSQTLPAPVQLTERKTMTTGCESCQTCNWHLQHSNFCTESMTKVMKNWELFVCLLAENGAGEWVSANTPLRSGWGLPTFAIDRTPRFECLHRCSTKQDPLSTGWLVKLNKGLNTNCVSISFRLIAETFISEFLSIDRSWSGSAFWASANGLSNQGLRLRSELTHQSSAKVKVSSLTFGNLVSKCSSDCKN